MLESLYDPHFEWWKEVTLEEVKKLVAKSPGDLFKRGGLYHNFPIYFAVFSHSRVEVVRYLCEKVEEKADEMGNGAGIGYCGEENGDTLLHLAADNNDFDLIPYLLSFGPSHFVDKPCNDGKTALERAQDLNGKESIELLSEPNYTIEEFRKRKRWEVEDAKAEKERLGALKVELLRRKEVKDASDTAEIEFEKIEAGWHSFAEKMCLQGYMYPSVAQSLGLNKIVPWEELQKAYIQNRKDKALAEKNGRRDAMKESEGRIQMQQEDETCRKQWAQDLARSKEDQLIQERRQERQATQEYYRNQELARKAKIEEEERLEKEAEDELIRKEKAKEVLEKKRREREERLTNEKAALTVPKAEKTEPKGSSAQSKESDDLGEAEIVTPRDDDKTGKRTAPEGACTPLLRVDDTEGKETAAEIKVEEVDLLSKNETGNNSEEEGGQDAVRAELTAKEKREKEEAAQEKADEHEALLEAKRKEVETEEREKAEKRRVEAEALLETRRKEIEAAERESKKKAERQTQILEEEKARHQEIQRQEAQRIADQNAEIEAQKRQLEEERLLLEKERQRLSDTHQKLEKKKRLEEERAQTQRNEQLRKEREKKAKKLEKEQERKRTKERKAKEKALRERMATAMIDESIEMVEDGDFEGALRGFQKVISYSQEIDDVAREVAACRHIGNVHIASARYMEALKFHQKAHGISLRLGDRKEECLSYGNLGDVYAAMGEIPAAIHHYNFCIDLAAGLGDTATEKKFRIQLIKINGPPSAAKPVPEEMKTGQPKAAGAGLDVKGWSCPCGFENDFRVNTCVLCGKDKSAKKKKRKESKPVDPIAQKRLVEKRDKTLAKNPQMIQSLYDQDEEKWAKCTMEHVKVMHAAAPNQVMTKQNGALPIHFACRSANCAVIKMLYRSCGIEAMESLQIADYDGNTALHVAAMAAGNNEVLPFLLEKFPGAAFVKNKDGKLPVDLANVTGANQKIIALLLTPFGFSEKYEGIVNLHDDNKVRWKATGPQHIDMFLRREPNSLGTRFGGNLPVHFAVKGALGPTLRKMHALNARSFDEKDRNGDTVLHIATKMGRLSSIAFLLRLHPALKEVKDKRGQTALEYAMQKKSSKLVLRLIGKDDKYAGIWSLYDRGAGRWKHTSPSDILFLHKENPFQVKTEIGELGIPLHTAAEYARTKTIEALWKLHKDGMYTENKTGESPVDIAIRLKRLNVIALFIGCNPFKTDVNVLFQNVFDTEEKAWKFSTKTNKDLVDKLKIEAKRYEKKMRQESQDRQRRRNEVKKHASVREAKKTQANFFQTAAKRRF